MSDCVSFLGGPMAFFFGKYPQWVRTNLFIITVVEILGMLHTPCNSPNRSLLQSKYIAQDVFGEHLTSEIQNVENKTEIK